MADFESKRGKVVLTVEEYEHLLRESGVGGKVGELPNNDGLRPLEKPEDAGTINNSKEQEAEGLTPVVKNEGREPLKEVPNSPTEEAKVEGETVDTDKQLDSNEYIAGRSMEKVPDLIVDPRKEEHPEEVARQMVKEKVASKGRKPQK